MKTQFDGRILDTDTGIKELAGRLRAFAASQGRVLEPLDSLHRRNSRDAVGNRTGQPMGQ
jgi:hypothetical protein